MLLFIYFRNSIPPTTTLENLKTKASAAEGNVFVDVGFWGGVIPDNQVNVPTFYSALPFMGDFQQGAFFA